MDHFLGIYTWIGCASASVSCGCDTMMKMTFTRFDIILHRSTCIMGLQCLATLESSMADIVWYALVFLRLRTLDNTGEELEQG